MRWFDLYHRNESRAGFGAFNITLTTAVGTSTTSPADDFSYLP
jgi:hypothetical protein